MRLAVILLFTIAAAYAQTVCPATPAYSVCDIALESAGPVNLSGEFRSPSHRTYLIPAFWDGARMILRVTPTEPGTWDFRLTDGKQGQFTATSSDSPGFVEPANVHHFRYTGTLKAHLWMGEILPPLEHAQFEAYVRQRAAQKFNHARVTLIPNREAFPDADRPNAAWFADLDSRLLLLNRLGMVADLAIAPGRNAFMQWFPERAQRESAVRYLVARYGAMNITWQGFEDFETYNKGRELLREVAGYISTLDQYHHLQTSGTLATSGPLFSDGWMKAVNFRSPDGQIAGVEHQLYLAPNLNDFGEGASTAVDFMNRLWSSSMDGQYPESVVPANSQAGNAAKVWYEFFADTRHWELEPYFDIENGKGIALEGIEYIVYVEKPGAVTVQVEKHSYDVEWVNPINGETVKVKKNLKDETFAADTPDNAHPWVLHISREGTKASMLKSYKFESREPPVQEVESNPAKVPFDIVEPSGDSISLSHPAPFAVKLTKETRSTRRMQYLWTGEITADEQSYRVIGTGAQGTFQIPANIAIRLPALLHVHLTAMNALGKVYALDRNYQLTQ